MPQKPTPIAKAESPKQASQATVAKKEEPKKNEPNTAVWPYNKTSTTDKPTPVLMTA